MKFGRKLFPILALAAAAAWAQPVVFTGGVVNAASYSLAGLPNSGIGQGAMFIVFGTNLGVVAGPPTSFPLPKVMGTTSIKVTAQGTTVDCIMLYTSPGQVAAILPSNTPVGAGKLTLTFNNQTSAQVDVTVVRSTFGTFTWNQAGSGPGIFQDPLDLLVNSLLVTAQAGEMADIWGTGLGPVTGDEAAGALPGDLRATIPVEVWVGGKQAEVLYAGRSGCCAGIDQIRFVVPDGVEGCYVSVAVKAGGVVSNFTSMSVAPNGALCSDPNGVSASDLQLAAAGSSTNVARLILTRITLALTVSGITAEVTSDLGGGSFATYSPYQMTAARGLTQSPSVGSCTIVQFQGLNVLPDDPTLPPVLDAGGTLSVTGPNGNKPVAKSPIGIYAGVLGGVALSLEDILDAIINGAPPDFLDPGVYTVSNGAGGAGASAVGSFSTQTTIPTLVTWSNKAQISMINRNQGLEITWPAGGDPNGFVSIAGIASLGGPTGPSATTPGEAFLCAERADVGRFVVPSVVLQALPPSPVGALIPSSFLLVGNSGAPAKFTANGLDVGYLTYLSLSGKNVVFQ